VISGRYYRLDVICYRRFMFALLNWWRSGTVPKNIGIISESASESGYSMRRRILKFLVRNSINIIYKILNAAVSRPLPLLYQYAVSNQLQIGMVPYGIECRLRVLRHCFALRFADMKIKENMYALVRYCACTYNGIVVRIDWVRTMMATWQLNWHVVGQTASGGGAHECRLVPRSQCLSSHNAIEDVIPLVSCRANLYFASLSSNEDSGRI
jgi:hypothetical protein